MHASEMTAGLRTQLPPTDSRHRRDIELLQRCVYDQVTLHPGSHLSTASWRADWLHSIQLLVSMSSKEPITSKAGSAGAFAHTTQVPWHEDIVLQNMRS